MNSIDWNFIASHLAKMFCKSIDLKTINRFSYAVHPKELINYAPPREKDQRFKAIYNFVYTVSKIPGLTDDNKVHSIYKLISAINETAGINLERIEEIFRKGYYINPASEKIKSMFNRIEKITIPNAYSNRNFHKEVVKLSKTYFLKGDYFQAVKMSCTGYNKKIQTLTGSKEDGTSLMGNVFGKSAKIFINKSTTESEKNEQDGVMHLSMGLVSAFRNPLAHETPDTWPVSKEDCLDILSLLSLLFRKLDRATIKK